MDELSNTRAASQRLIEANLLPSETLTRIQKFISYSDLIINYKKTVKNDTVNGQQSTDSISQLAPRLGGGCGNFNLDFHEAPPTWGSISVPLDAVYGGTPAYPDDNPKTAFGAKKVPLELVPPSVEHALAEAFSLGAKKYGPYNWRENMVSSNVYYAAALRHLKAWWDGEDLDPESGFSHLSHVLACIGILVDANSIGKLNDNRPPKGAASDLQREWLKRNE